MSPDSAADSEASIAAQLADIQEIEARLEILRQQYRFHAHEVKRLSLKKPRTKQTQLEMLGPVVDLPPRHPKQQRTPTPELQVQEDAETKAAAAAAAAAASVSCKTTSAAAVVAAEEVIGRRSRGRASKRTKHYSGDISKQNSESSSGTESAAAAAAAADTATKTSQALHGVAATAATTAATTAAAEAEASTNNTDDDGEEVDEPIRGSRRKPGAKQKKKPVPKSGLKKTKAAADAVAAVATTASASSSSSRGKGGRKSTGKAAAAAAAATVTDDDDSDEAVAAGGAGGEGVPEQPAANLQEGDMGFLCPWPGCDRQFERVKSRSAHLKWHGGNYKGSNGGGAVRMPKKVAGEDASSSSNSSGKAGTKRGASSASSAADSNGSGKRAKRQRGGGGNVGTSNSAGGGAPSSPGFTVGAKIIMPSGDHAGKVGVVGKIEEGPANDGKIYHVVVVSGKGKLEKSQTIQLSSSEFGGGGGSNNNNVQFTEGMQVFGRTITSKGPAFRHGIIEEVQTDESPNLYKFVPAGFEAEAAWMPKRDLIDDKPPTMSQLRTGTRVCALPGDKNGLYFHGGSIQRIESSRIRVNFDSFQIAWRKAHEVRILAEQPL